MIMRQLLFIFVLSLLDSCSSFYVIIKCSRQFVVLEKCLHISFILGWRLKEFAVWYRFLLIIEGCAVTSFCTNFAIYLL